MALDVGSARVGVALSDPLGSFAQPLLVIHRKKENTMDRVCALLAEHDVQTLVVGLPLTLEGEKKQAALAVEGFCEALQKRTDVPLVLWDERMTTAAAERAMIDANVRRSDRKGSIDQVAAAHILQSYLDANP